MKLKEVSIELAKKLKEKGFNIKCDNWYRLSSDFKELYGRNAKRGGLISPISQGIGIATAPSLEFAKMWFLEQKILIEVNPCDSWEEWHFQIIAEDSMAPFYVFTSGGENGQYRTYNEALEKGLSEACELI